MDILVETPMNEVKQNFNCHACQKACSDSLEAKKCFENCMGKSSIEQKKNEMPDLVENIDEVKGSCLDANETKNESFYSCRETNETITSFLEVESKDPFAEISKQENEKPKDTFGDFFSSSEPKSEFSILETSNKVEEEIEKDSNKTIEAESKDPLVEISKNETSKNASNDFFSSLISKSESFTDKSPSKEIKNLKEVSTIFEDKSEAIVNKTSKKVHEKNVEAPKDSISTLKPELESTIINTAENVDMKDTSGDFFGKLESELESLDVATSIETSSKVNDKAKEVFTTFEDRFTFKDITNETSKKVDEKNMEVSNDVGSTLKPESETPVNNTTEKEDMIEVASGDIFSKSGTSGTSGPESTNAAVETSKTVDVETSIKVDEKAKKDSNSPIEGESKDASCDFFNSQVSRTESTIDDTSSKVNENTKEASNDSFGTLKPESKSPATNTTEKVDVKAAASGDFFSSFGSESVIPPVETSKKVDVKAVATSDFFSSFGSEPEPNLVKTSKKEKDKPKKTSNDIFGSLKPTTTAMETSKDVDEPWADSSSKSKGGFDLFDSMFNSAFKKVGAQQMYKCEICPKTYTNSLEAKRCLEACQKPPSPEKSEEKNESIVHEDIAETASKKDDDEEDNVIENNVEEVDPFADNNESILDQGSDQEGEWSCIQCPEVLPTKKSMMHHVANDCSGKSKSPTKEALDDTTDTILDEILPPNKKSRKEGSEKGTPEKGTPEKNNDPDWSPRITSSWSKNKAGTKLTARKSTGGKAPKDGDKIFKCEKCEAILTTQDKLDQHVDSCLVTKKSPPKAKKPLNQKEKTPPPVSPKMTKAVSVKNSVQPLTLLPKKPVSPSKLSAALKSSKERPNIIKPLHNNINNIISHVNGSNKVVKVTARPSGQRVGGQAPSLRGSNPVPVQNGMGHIAKVATRFKCLQCPKSYVNKNAMERHFQDVHKGVSLAPSSNGTRNSRASTRSNYTQPKQPTVQQKTLYKKVTKGIVLGEVDLTDDDPPEENISNKPTPATQPEPVNKQFQPEPVSKQFEPMEEGSQNYIGTENSAEDDFDCILPD